MTAAITDFSQFAMLRLRAERNDPAALREVAGQFEALFLQTLLAGMRETSLGDPLFGDSDQLELYQGMLDQQLSMRMAEGRGIGLADMLVRQLGGEPVAAIPRSPFGAGGALQGAPVAASAGQRIGPGNRQLWSDPAAFTRDIWPHAERAAARLNVVPEAVVAQAALETGWGAHVMQRPGGATSFNLFGIKAGGGWAGDSVSRATLEFEAGIPRRQVGRFRAYDDLAAGFDDYTEFLTQNPRYRSVRDHGGSISGFAQALQASGYATDPQYAEKIVRIANSDTMKSAVSSLKPAGERPISHGMHAGAK